MVVLDTKSDGQADRKKLDDSPSKRDSRRTSTSAHRVKSWAIIDRAWMASLEPPTRRQPALRTRFSMPWMTTSPSREVLGDHRQCMDGRLGVLYETPARPSNAILDAPDVNSSPNVHGRRVRFSTYPPPDSAPISIPSLFHAHPFSPPYCVSFTPFPPFKSLESLTLPLANVGSFGARFPSLMLMIACFLTSHAISRSSTWQTSQIAKPTNPSLFRRRGPTSTMTYGTRVHPLHQCPRSQTTYTRFQPRQIFRIS